MVKVSPRMTKTEVKEYLTKIYGIAVSKVNTVNHEGEWKRIYGGRGMVKPYRRRNYKIAYVMYTPKEGEVAIKRA